MIKTILGVSAIVALALAAVPASAARLTGCSGSNLLKSETLLEAMADGDAKSRGFHEMAAAQTALLDGKMGACAVHLAKVMQIESAK